MSRRSSLVWAGLCLLLLIGAAAFAPEHLGNIKPDLALQSPLDVRRLLDRCAADPCWIMRHRVPKSWLCRPWLRAYWSRCLACLVALLRCIGSVAVNAGIQWFTEIVGALPRMVVILVVALVLPREYRSLLPLACTFGPCWRHLAQWMRLQRSPRDWEVLDSCEALRCAWLQCDPYLPGSCGGVQPAPCHCPTRSRNDDASCLWRCFVVSFVGGKPARPSPTRIR